MKGGRNWRIKGKDTLKKKKGDKLFGRKPQEEKTMVIFSYKKKSQNGWPLNPQQSSNGKCYEGERLIN